MDISYGRFSLPFKRILYYADSFVVETDSARYRLTCGISEHYILSNLKGSCKKDGILMAELTGHKNQPVLSPIAILHGENTTWIATTEEHPDLPVTSDLSPLAALKVDKGEEYPDGFIDSSRTSLSYPELMSLEKTLHDSDYVEELYRQYRQRHPDEILYDARLHYFMIKGIRKHKHYSDDFITPCDEFSFYLDWHDPFPWYLYIRTFGGIDTWPSHAKMRLMADNGCRAGVPLALKVLRNEKANDRIKHYAIVLSGMEERNTELVLSYKTTHPRAVSRVLYERGLPGLYEMLLDNAHGILAGSNDDILDDFPVIHGEQYDRLEEYSVNHRGFIRLDTLSEEQVRALWNVYRQIAQQVSQTKDECERLRLGNSFRAFLLALIYNETSAVGDIIGDVYRNYNWLLYSEWSQDSKYVRMDIMWMDYLFALVTEWNILDNFWQWLQFHAERYDHYYLYTNQHFFISIYSKVAYHVLEPAIFYDALAPLIDSNYVLVEPVWRGVTSDKYPGDDDPSLDHRWNNMFCEYDYYAWSGKARFYYHLVRHRIEPHPAGWNGKWQPRRRKLDIIFPR